MVSETASTLKNRERRGGLPVRKKNQEKRGGHWLQPLSPTQHGLGLIGAIHQILKAKRRGDERVEKVCHHQRGSERRRRFGKKEFSSSEKRGGGQYRRGNSVINGYKKETWRRGKAIGDNVRQ